MDNQHIADDLKLDSHELAYLAGCIECDGSIHIGYHHVSTGMRPQCCINFTNTNEVLYTRILNDLKAIAPKIYIRHLATRENKPNSKPVYAVEVCTQTGCKLVLEAILPWLLSKKAQADLVLEFIYSRMSKGAKRGCGYLPLSRRELQIVYDIRVLNHRGISQTADRGLLEAIEKAKF